MVADAKIQTYNILTVNPLDGFARRLGFLSSRGAEGRRNSGQRTRSTMRLFLIPMLSA